MTSSVGHPLVVRTLDDQVYEAIRDQIVHGLPPGTPLRLADLAGQFNISIMPVRAALQRLEGDGLVRQQPHRGAIVSPLELEDLEEIQALRAGIEGYAARLGAVAIGQSDLKAMRALLKPIAASARAGDADAYLASTQAFHDLCYDASGRRRLSALVATYRRAAERYVRVVLTGHPGFVESLEAQKRFLDACEAHDGQRAEEELRGALAWITAQVSRLLKETPGSDTSPLRTGPSGARTPA